MTAVLSRLSCDGLKLLAISTTGSNRSRECPKEAIELLGLKCREGRVEDRRCSLGHLATLRFPSSLIEPDVPISGIRLSDWFHREAHSVAARGKRSRRSRRSSP